jgi:hypothetical protein
MMTVVHGRENIRKVPKVQIQYQDLVDKLK